MIGLDVIKFRREFVTVDLAESVKLGDDAHPNWVTRIETLVISLGNWISHPAMRTRDTLLYSVRSKEPPVGQLRYSVFIAHVAPLRIYRDSLALPILRTVARGFAPQLGLPDLLIPSTPYRSSTTTPFPLLRHLHPLSYIHATS
jgi:hypothetical protein